MKGSECICCGDWCDGLVVGFKGECLFEVGWFLGVGCVCCWLVCVCIGDVG